MSSQTVTRNDLTAILNEVLPNPTSHDVIIDNGTASLTTGNTVSSISGNIALTSGIWLLVGDVSFPDNTNGSRYLEWKQGNSSILASRVIVPAASSGFSTRIQSIAIVDLTETTNVCLQGYQYTGTSGTSISVGYWYRLVRIA